MYDVLIIGAGVVGCSIAREMSKYKLSVCVLEKECDVAEGTTKANSAIIHAGFDAKKGSLKAKLNVEGNLMFDRLSKELNFPFKRIGALVLCFNQGDIHRLNELKLQGEANGVPDLKVLNREELRRFEPNISKEAAAALYAPTSGIVCPYEMTIALAENAFENGVEFKFESKVTNIEKEKDIFKVTTEKEQLKSKVVINSSGVFSDEINNMISNDKINIIPRKGEYCLFDKEVGNLVSRTIFQLPGAMGKGVLVTPTVDGNLLLGPNAVDIDDKECRTTTKEGIEEIVLKGRLSVENLPLNKVIASFSGVRAHSMAEDFIIGEALDVENFINVAGIESPGLSSAPAIASEIETLLVEKLKPEFNEDFNPIRKAAHKFRELSNEERKELIKSAPEYGKIVCRCEVVTEGEIIDAIKRPLGAKTLDGVKRRTRAGMGRCQAGFCTTRIIEILSRELNMELTEITKFGRDSRLLLGRNKEDLG